LPDRDLELPGNLGLRQVAGLEPLQGSQAHEFTLVHREKLHEEGFLHGDISTESKRGHF
jgi:hypothetical protein